MYQRIMKWMPHCEENLFLTDNLRILVATQKPKRIKLKNIDNVFRAMAATVYSAYPETLFFEQLESTENSPAQAIKFWNYFLDLYEKSYKLLEAEILIEGE